MRAVLLAGGKGTRLHPYSLVLPKPLMPISDFPILEIGLRQLQHYGFTDVTIAVGHLAQLIMVLFGDGRKLGLNIQYAIEDVPRGTIGPLAGIPEITKEGQPVLLMNGDTLTDLDFAAFARSHGSDGALVSVATFRKEVAVDLGVMEWGEDGTLVNFREKPVIPLSVSMGIYMLSPGVVELIPAEGLFGFDHLMHICLQRNLPVRSYPHQGIWLDIGRPDDYRSAVDIFEKQRARFCPWEKDVP